MDEWPLLRNLVADNYMEIVNELLSFFVLHGYNMSINTHLLFSHLDKFTENLGNVSDEKGESFHQEFMVIHMMEPEERRS